MPLVSVIVPVLNGEHYISDCIASVLNQSCKDFELIVIDDGSTDGTHARIAAFDAPRIRYIRQPKNGGTATATQTGVEASSGKYIALLDADDMAEPNRLELQTRFLNGQPRIAVLGGRMTGFGDGDHKLAVPRDDGTIKVQLLAGAGNIYNPTAMIRRAFLDKHALRWRAEYASVFDWAFYVEVMMQGGRFANLDASLTQYRIHAAQQSKDLAPFRPHIAAIRTRIMAAFFPMLTAEECSALEPLLQRIAPPPLSHAAVNQGLAILEKALKPAPSALGEDRAALAAYLHSCRNRWTAALAGH